MGTSRRGAALFLTFLMMLVLVGLAIAVGVFSKNSLTTGQSQLLDKQAFYVAEAGWQRARQQLGDAVWNVSSCPSGTPCTESFPTSSPIGEYQVTITGSSPYTITSTGAVPTTASPLAQRQMIEGGVTVTSSLGVTNLSLSATALASSSNGSNTPAKANDGLGNTQWEAGTNGNDSWLGMDFTTATILGKMVVNEKNFIDGVTIEFADVSPDNPSSWTTASGLSVVESPSKTWTATFTAASHRYFRARFTSVPSGKKASVTELESYGATMSIGKGNVATAL